MTKLTQEQEELLKIRREKLSLFLEERMPVLVEFLQDLGFNNPQLVLLEAPLTLQWLSDRLKNEAIEQDDRIWLASRVMYFVGEYFAQQYKGAWIICQASDSPFFGNYVVGEFENMPVKIMDPFSVAQAYINQPVGRDLYQMIKEVERQLMEIQVPES